MVISDNLVGLDWMALAGRLVVGLTFIWTGALKAIAPQTFASHLEGLGVLPRRTVPVAVTSIAGLEVGLGAALVLGVLPILLYPTTILLLVVLSAVGWWGVKTGKATDCGCYGGFVDPSIKQSVGLNGFFVLLLVFSWRAATGAPELTAGKATIIVALGIASALVAWFAQRFSAKNGRPLFDINPLKVGNRWRNRWAGGATKNVKGEMLVAFLGPDCPYCALWVKMGNAVIQSSALPRVVGVVAATGEKREEFVRNNGIKFPVANISQSLMGRMAQAVPTTVLIESGLITKKWVGSAPPPEFVDRLKDAFFPRASSLEPGSPSSSV